MPIKLQIFTKKKFQRWTLIILFLAVIVLDSAFKKDDNYYLQVFLKECKYIEKRIVRHIHDNFSYFSFSDEPDEEEVKTIKLVIFWKCIFWESNFKESNDE